MKSATLSVLSVWLFKLCQMPYILVSCETSVRVPCESSVLVSCESRMKAMSTNPPTGILTLYSYLYQQWRRNRGIPYLYIQRCGKTIRATNRDFNLLVLTTYSVLTYRLIPVEG